MECLENAGLFSGDQRSNHSEYCSVKHVHFQAVCLNKCVTRLAKCCSDKYKHMYPFNHPHMQPHTSLWGVRGCFVTHPGCWVPPLPPRSPLRCSASSLLLKLCALNRTLELVAWEKALKILVVSGSLAQKSIRQECNSLIFVKRDFLYLSSGGGTEAAGEHAVTHMHAHLPLHVCHLPLVSLSLMTTFIMYSAGIISLCPTPPLVLSPHACSSSSISSWEGLTNMDRLMSDDRCSLCCSFKTKDQGPFHFSAFILLLWLLPPASFTFLLVMFHYLHNCCRPYFYDALKRMAVFRSTHWHS